MYKLPYSLEAGKLVVKDSIIVLALVVLALVILVLIAVVVLVRIILVWAVLALVVMRLMGYIEGARRKPLCADVLRL